MHNVSEGGVNIKILGTGCKKCQAVEAAVKSIVAETGVDATVEKVTSVMDIASYGVFGTPAVIVNGEVTSVGRIPTREDILSWLKQ